MFPSVSRLLYLPVQFTTNSRGIRILRGGDSGQIYEQRCQTTFLSDVVQALSHCYWAIFVFIWRTLISSGQLVTIIQSEPVKWLPSNIAQGAVLDSNPKQ